MSAPTGITASGAALVRARTRALHEAVELATELPTSLLTIGDVVGLLGRWRTLATRLEPIAGAAAGPSLLPTIDQDLAALGAAPTASRPPSGQLEDQAAPDPRPAALGTAWVLAGARLGLASMAGHVAAVARRPLHTFARQDPRALIAVRTALDELSDHDLQTASDAATSAFEVAAQTLGAPPWS